MAPERLYVPITPPEFERLRRLAWSERRRPQDQAAWLLSHALATPKHEARHTAADPSPVTVTARPYSSDEAESGPA
jgi:hypothetical protein